MASTLIWFFSWIILWGNQIFSILGLIYTPKINYAAQFIRNLMKFNKEFSFGILTILIFFNIHNFYCLNLLLNLRMHWHIQRVFCVFIIEELFVLSPSVSALLLFSYMDYRQIFKTNPSRTGNLGNDNVSL